MSKKMRFVYTFEDYDWSVSENWHVPLQNTLLTNQDLSPMLEPQGIAETRVWLHDGCHGYTNEIATSFTSKGMLAWRWRKNLQRR